MPKFTDAQQAAVDTNACNILVSAAAGAGKTAVLTQRILRHIVEGKDIDSLLVVTFTEAATAEMRERIGEILANPGDGYSQEVRRRLLSQLMRLPMANVSTIHSFCRKLVQEHFQAVDIDPAFRVGNAAELAILSRQVMDELFEYEYEHNPQFVDLAEVYGGKTMDTSLDELVRKLYDFMRSDPYPEEAAHRYARNFDMASVDDTPWVNVVREELAVGVEGALEGLVRAIKICSGYGGPGNYITRLEADIEMLQSLQGLLVSGSFQQLHNAFNAISFGNLPSRSKEDDVELALQVQDIRKTGVKDRINKLVSGVFFAPIDKMQSDIHALAPRVKAMLALAAKFGDAFAAEKRARNILDFNDLEHFAIRILYPNGGNNPPAMLPQFEEVLTDEYQDSNMVQEMILSAVAKRRFMVGDMKQSIYRFRRANPQLFQQKYSTYPLEEGSDCIRIDLSHNFRSRPEVLDAVNFFFAQLMCEKVGEIKYDNAAALHKGLETYPPLPHGPEMWVELLDQSAEDEANDAPEEDRDENIVAETRMIARTIQELLDPQNPRMVWDKNLGASRPCQLGDIAILSRGLNSIAGSVIEELKCHGIDAVADMDAGFLTQPEVKTALAFLRVIDNPRQDIELLTVLLSPAYGFSADELLQMRYSGGEGPLLYDYLLHTASCDGALAEKAQAFLAQLTSWRAIVPHTPVSRIIAMVYDATKYPAHVLSMPGGVMRQANLRLVLERAVEFEETSMKGLFHFVSYIERMYDLGLQESGAIAEVVPSPQGRVRVMTIHKSKGLEFPIVICAFLGKRFNTDDSKSPLVLNPALGVGPYCVDTVRRTRANTIARFSISQRGKREARSEEMRCLYVALTRAKELLILTGRDKNLDAALAKWGSFVSSSTTLLPAYYRIDARSYLDWLMPCLLRHRDAAEFTTALDVNQATDVWQHCARFRLRRHHVYPAQFNTVISTPHENHALVLQPYEKMLAVPSKLSITEIHRLFDITPDSTLHNEPPPTFAPPAFMQGETGPTPAQLGTALHLVAEHINYQIHTSLAAVNQLIADLTSRLLLTPQEATFVDRNKIMTLVNSSLAARLRVANNVKRETPFVLAIPANELYSSASGTDTVLVHGIIDCYFEEDGEVVLVDYKSDATPARHTTQLAIYKRAIAQATTLNVKEVLIYSFALGGTVTVDV